VNLRILLQRYSAYLWPAAVLAIGIVLSVLLGDTLQQRALETWQKRAQQESAQRSMTLLGWVEESYATLSALVALVENSGKVDASEFLNAVDGLEARAKVNFMPVKAMMEFGRNGWRTKYSSVPATANAAIPAPDNAPVSLLTDTLTRAQDIPNEAFMSAPFVDPQGKQHVYVVLVPSGKPEVALVGVFAVQRMLGNLFEESGLDGVNLDLKLGSEGSDTEAVLSEEKATGPIVYRSSTLTQTAHVNLELIWQFSETFDGGVDRRLGQGVLAGGTLVSVLVAAFVAIMRRQNQRTQQRVDEATRGLTDALTQVREEALRHEAMLTGKAKAGELSRQLQDVATYAQFGQRTLTYLAPWSGAEVAAFFVKTEGTNVFRCVAGHGIAPESCMEFQPGEGLAGEVALSGERMLCRDVADGLLRIETTALSIAPRAIAIVPIKISTGIIAVLELAYLQEPRNQDDILGEALPVIAFSLELLTRKLFDTGVQTPRTEKESQ